MATTDVKVTEGVGANIAAYSFSEDAETKKLQRVALNTNAGVEILPSTAANQATIIAALAAIDGHVDGLETLAGAATPAGANLIGKVGLDQTTEGTTNRVVAGKIAYFDVTLVVDTSAYASGDVLVIPQSIANAMRVADFCGVLQSMTVIDEADQGVSMDVYFFDTAASLGTINAAPSISDADARSILAIVPVVSGDFHDLGGVRVASLNGLGYVLKPLTGFRNLYVGAVNGTGTPTYGAASDLKLRLGILLD